MGRKDELQVVSLLLAKPQSGPAPDTWRSFVRRIRFQGYTDCKFTFPSVGSPYPGTFHHVNTLSLYSAIHVSGRGRESSQVVEHEIENGRVWTRLLSLTNKVRLSSPVRELKQCAVQKSPQLRLIDCYIKYLSLAYCSALIRNSNWEEILDWASV